MALNHRPGATATKWRTVFHGSPATVAAGMVLLGFLVLYLAFQSANYTGDGTLFADLVRNYGHDDSNGYYRLLLHPHHILYGPMATAFSFAMGPPQAGVIYPEILRLCQLSSLLSVAALGIFFATLRRVTGRPWAALAATLFLGVSHAYWAFSINVEVQALNMLAVVLFLAALSRAPDRWDGPLLGIAHGFAVLCHLLNGLMVIPAMWHLLFRRAAGSRGRPVLTYIASATFIVALGYLPALLWLGLGSPSEILEFLRPDGAGSYLSLPTSGLRPALTGFQTVFLGGPLVTAGMAVPWYHALRWVLPLALVGMLLMPRRHTLPPAASRLRNGAWIMLAAYALLWVTWDAGNTEFLIWAAPPVAALLSIAVATRGYPTVIALFLILSVILGTYHFSAVIRPQVNPCNNRALVETQFIGTYTQPDDCILISGVGDYRVGMFYLRYFAYRRRLVLQWEILRQGDPLAAAENTRRALAEEFAAGHRVLATSELFDPNTSRQLLELHGFTSDHLGAALHGLELRPVARLPDGLTLLDLVRAGVPEEDDRLPDE